ncbi:MAG: alkaline shock response membrane anchor protein AmaP [Candidatus Omnitrophica bacterium]|nr:alkaline shock response membrane anchor protein AmaP [Candidatus Omnitrophota bacterium]
MNVFTRLTVLCYVTIILFLGCFALLYALNIIPYKGVLDLLFVVYFDDNLRAVVGGVAVGLLLINFLLYRQYGINVHKEKVIAFDNPAGRVSVALGALEDLIQRTLSRFPEVKEGKVDIRASKRGLNVKVRMVLCSEVNIPELTAIVQDTAKRKLQDMIGFDEPLNVTVYISKILPERVKEKKPGRKEEGEERPDVHIPFQGYRA